MDVVMHDPVNLPGIDLNMLWIYLIGSVSKCGVSHLVNKISVDTVTKDIGDKSCGQGKMKNGQIKDREFCEHNLLDTLT